jgi:hypothetical protein
MRRPDTPPRGTDFPRTSSFLTGDIRRNVVWQDQRARRRERHSLSNFDSPRLQLCNFIQHRAWRNDHPISNETLGVVVEDPRWNQVKYRSFTVNHEGVTGVVSSLISNDGCDISCKKINDFTFAFVAPLGTNNDNISASHQRTSSLMRI